MSLSSVMTTSQAKREKPWHGHRRCGWASCWGADEIVTNICARTCLKKGTRGEKDNAPSDFHKLFFEFAFDKCTK